jgi:hypothetical protein
MIKNNSNLVQPVTNFDNQHDNSLIYHLNIVINRIINHEISPIIATSNICLNTISDVSSTTYTRIPSPTYSVDSETSDDEASEIYDDSDDYNDYDDYDDNLEQDSNSSTSTSTDSEDSYIDNLSESIFCGTYDGYQSWSGSESGEEYHHSGDDD